MKLNKSSIALGDNDYLIKAEFKSPLSKIIKQEYNALVSIISTLDSCHRNTKNIENMHEKISVSDLIAYQIGWGNLLIAWYENGLNGKMPQMPGEGFTKWDYAGIASHFYKKYAFDGGVEQDQALNNVVNNVLALTDHEYETGNLDKIGVWDWCTLASGRQWSLSKWIRINTAAPYRRAAALIKKVLSISVSLCRWMNE